MDDTIVLENERAVFVMEDIYRSSPFEFLETSLGGQRVLRIGNVSLVTGSRLVQNPFNIVVTGGLFEESVVEESQPSD